jgi:AcrR family transcriptional regulator
MATKTASKKKKKKATEKKSDKRAYNSPLRQQQMEQTRQLIVEALAEQVWKEGLSEFSVPKVAKRAGVATRTVYRYFPTRDDLLAAVEKELREKHPEPDFPKALTDLPEHIPTLYAYMEENRTMIEAALTAGLAGELHSKMRAERQSKARQRFGDALAQFNEREQRQLNALFRAIGGSSMWRAMTTQGGLSGEEAAEVVQWLYRHMLNGLGIKKGQSMPKTLPWGEKE